MPTSALNLSFLLLVLLSAAIHDWDFTNSSTENCRSSNGLSNAFSTDSKVERHYETEFELKPEIKYPHDFKQFDFETLSVRIPGFNIISHFKSDGSYQGTGNINNWELFAIRYWFETRVPYSSCPMKPRGIATRVDWAFMVPCMFGDPNVPPRTIFVHHYMLSHFIESTLRFMDKSYRFVLLSGGTDLTIPRSTDVRYSLLRGFSNSLTGGNYFQTLVNAPQLIHWFCENHDLQHSKISTLPTGMVDNADDRSAFPDPKTIKPLLQRPLQVMVSDRVRDGRGQWETRRKVQEMCLRRKDICLHPQPINSEVGISHKDFAKIVVSVPFIACPHGGGIDPSPKAWEALLLGTVPILQSTVLDDGYKRFPVIFVRSWEEFFQHPNTSSLMEQWALQLAPYYEAGSTLREQTLLRLKTDYWMSLVELKIEQYEQLNTSRRLDDTYGEPAIFFRP